MEFENQTYLASKKVDINGNEIDCIMGINNNTHAFEAELDSLQADGWVIVSKVKFDTLAAAYNEGKRWFWDSRNIPHATKVERDAAESTYMER
jgi:hypothetical protein